MEMEFMNRAEYFKDKVDVVSKNHKFARPHSLKTSNSYQ